MLPTWVPAVIVRRILTMSRLLAESKSAAQAIREVGWQQWVSNSADLCAVCGDGGGCFVHVPGRVSHFCSLTVCVPTGV